MASNLDALQAGAAFPDAFYPDTCYNGNRPMSTRLYILFSWPAFQKLTELLRFTIRSFLLLSHIRNFNFDFNRYFIYFVM